MSEKKPTVAICIPSTDTWKAKTAVAVTALMTYSQMQGIPVALINREGSMITASRNGLVDVALEHNLDYVLWIDADMVFPPDALVKLLAHDKDIVGCMYNKRVPPYQTLGLLEGAQKDISGGGLHEARYLPGGFLLVKSDVYRKVGWPWYYEVYRWPGDAFNSFAAMIRDRAAIDFPNHVMNAMLASGNVQRWIEENHQADLNLHADSAMSEDYTFCKKARRYGYEIWADLSLTFQLAHLGEVPITCKPEPKQQLLAAE